MEKKKADIKQFDKEHAPTKANATIKSSSKG